MAGNLYVCNKLISIKMEKLILEIDTRSNKGKYLLGLIKEMAKDGSFVKIQKNDLTNELRTSVREMKAGKTKPIDQLFK